MGGRRTVATARWERGEHAALALRHRLGVGDAPVNVWDVIREVGIGVVLRDFGIDGGDGAYILRQGRALIVVNAAKGRKDDRMRFVAAHLLGHHEMHRLGRSSIVWSDLNVFEHGVAQVDPTANSFAAAFLAPPAGVADIVADKLPHEVEPLDAARVMIKFGISYGSACYRLLSIGVISQAQRKAIYQEGIGRLEGMLVDLGRTEDAFPPGLSMPAEYLARVERFWRDKRISDDRAAEMLRLDVGDARSWLRSRTAARRYHPRSQHA